MYNENTRIIGRNLPIYLREANAGNKGGIGMSATRPRILLVFLIIVFLVAMGASTALAPAAGEAEARTAEVEIQAGQGGSGSPREVEGVQERWTMPDGTVLPVSVYWPAATSSGEAFPLIIYVHGWCCDRSMCDRAAEDCAARGYVAIAVTTRGWFGAGGEVGMMNPQTDIKDISDVITMASQDERFPVLEDALGPVVGVTGYSMGGCYSYLIAPRENPLPGDPGDPRVRAVVPMHGSFDLVYSIYPNGGWKLFWTTLLFFTGYAGKLSGFLFNFITRVLDDRSDGWEKIQGILGDLSTLLNDPLCQLDYKLPYIFGVAIQRRMDEAPAAIEWAKPHSARYWCDPDYDGTAEHPIVSPMLILAGWQDDLFYANEALMAYTSTTAPKRLIIDNHGHVGGLPGPYPVDLPSKPQYQWTLEQTMKWFDHYLKGMDNGADREARLTFYRDSDGELSGRAPDYPLPGTTQASYYLGGGSNGTGRLTANRLNGGGSQRDFFINIGLTGSISLPYIQDATEILGWEPMEIPRRLDFFDIPFTERAYISDPLPADLTIMGPPRLELYYQSSDLFTQFVPWLFEVAPDGTETLLSRGFFEGYNPQAWSTNNNAANPIEMQACYHRFPAGSRIKLELATADIPSQLPVLGFTLLFIYHTRSMPSRLILPTVPTTY
jgi:putative CocE/NonD family hydrolase